MRSIEPGIHNHDWLRHANAYPPGKSPSDSRDKNAAGCVIGRFVRRVAVDKFATSK
jgi:hypothetical protein